MVVVVMPIIMVMVVVAMSHLHDNLCLRRDRSDAAEENESEQDTFHDVYLTYDSKSFRQALPRQGIDTKRLFTEMGRKPCGLHRHGITAAWTEETCPCFCCLTPEVHSKQRIGILSHTHLRIHLSRVHQALIRSAAKGYSNRFVPDMVQEMFIEL